MIILKKNDVIKHEIIGKRLKVIFPVIVIVLLVCQSHKLIVGSKIVEKAEYGYWNYEEVWNRELRWTMKEAFSKITATGNYLSFSIVVSKINSSLPEGLKVVWYLNEKIFDTMHFFNGGEKTVWYYVPGAKTKDLDIRMKVNKAFCPAIAMKTRDERELGILLSKFQFDNKAPVNGTGFYAYEKIENKDNYICSENSKTMFRWTNKQAFLDIKKEIGLKGKLYYQCMHPDIKLRSVNISFWLGDSLINKESVGDTSWRSLSLTLPHDSEILIIDVDRT